MEEKHAEDLTMIRHAESDSNLATENYVTKHQIIYEWAYLSKNKDYLQNIKYAFGLVDPLITPDGVQQVAFPLPSVRKPRKSSRGSPRT